jgi:hypothetical protein
VNTEDLNSPIIARLESEIFTLRGALNLSRERAEDAESDLAEARRELANETARADDAERERDRLLADEVDRQDKEDKENEDRYQQYLRDQAAPPVKSSELSKQVAEFLLGDDAPGPTKAAGKKAPRKRKTRAVPA